MGGAKALEFDKILRTLGFNHLAAQTLPTLDAPTLHKLQAYSEGVNACLEDKTCLNLETLLFSIATPIEPWTVQNCVLMSKLIGFFMTYDYAQELQRSYIDAIFKNVEGLEDFADLFLSTESTEWSKTILDD